VKGTATSNFPSLPVFPTAGVVKISAPVLCEMIAKTGFAIAMKSHFSQRAREMGHPDRGQAWLPRKDFAEISRSGVCVPHKSSVCPPLTHLL
jgi:hypothetical protein